MSNKFYVHFGIFGKSIEFLIRVFVVRDMKRVDFMSKNVQKFDYNFRIKLFN